MTHSSLLGDLLALHEVLDEDLAIDLEKRKHRDRDIGQRLQGHRNQPVVQIRKWLQENHPFHARKSSVQGVRLYHSLNVVLLAAGMLAGWGLASAALFYDGKQPINIINAVAILVLPQIILLLMWLVMAMPGRLPLFKNIAATFGFLNPGRLVGHLAESFSSKEVRGLTMLWNPDNTAYLNYASRWMFSFWSQLFAFSFNIGVVACTLYLVSFSDLAFVWSTTLNIGNDSFQQLMSTFSAPWSTLVPAAAPDALLIDNSRFYRMDEGAYAGAVITPERARELGQWWPFLMASVISYGLIPRVITLTFSWFRMRHHLGKALCALPGSPELLARMNSPLVSTLAAKPEVTFKPSGKIAATNTIDPQYALACPLIDWSNVGVSEDEITKSLAAFGIEIMNIVHAGGRQSTEQDQALIASLCKKRWPGLAILVRAWEPPMLDFLDFIRAIRSQCGARLPIIILLWGGGEGASGLDQETWRLTLGQLADPDVHLEVLGAQA